MSAFARLGYAATRQRERQMRRFKSAVQVQRYAESLQQPDGIFIHALEGPHAWGRGNGFALLGVTEALTYLPDTSPDRARAHCQVDEFSVP